MIAIEGFDKITPQIKKIHFPVKGKIGIILADGREIICPLQKFPSIKKLNEEQRKQSQIIDGIGFTFIDCDEVFHIQQVLGDFENYKYKSPV